MLIRELHGDGDDGTTAVTTEAWYQLPTNRKWPMVDQMMTSSTTSRERS